MNGTDIFGTLVPQCFIEKSKYDDILNQVINECRRTHIVGYISVKWFAWKTNLNETKLRLSGIYPYLTGSLLNAACLALQCRLGFDPKTYEMISKRELHWELPYLSRSVYADKVFII